MKNIEVSKIIDPIPASDGAGVKLKRSIGVEPNYFDPFLMLDEFGSENSEDYIQKLTWVWCIKESLYKLYATPGMSFKKHFMVIPFGKEKNSTVAWILDETKHQCFEGMFLEFEGFGCAITTPLI